MTTEKDDEIFIYVLADPQKVASRLNLYGSLLFPKLSYDQSKFFISESSGFVTFVNEKEIWNVSNSFNIARDSIIILAKALDFIDTCNKRIERYRDVNQISISDLPPLFPSVHFLKNINIAPVYFPDTNKAAHWIVQFWVYLPMNRNKEKALISGASIEMRIRPFGQIVAIESQWRQPVQRISIKKLTFNHEISFSNKRNTKDSSKSIGNKEAYNPFIFYIMADGIEYQRLLTPFYWDDMTGTDFMEHHNGVKAIKPATKYSLVADLEQKYNDNGVSVKANVFNVSNVSNKIKFYWTICALNKSTSEINHFTNTDTINLGKGVFDVHLVVEMLLNNEISSTTYINNVVYSNQDRRKNPEIIQSVSS